MYCLLEYLISSDPNYVILIQDEWIPKLVKTYSILFLLEYFSLLQKNLISVNPMGLHTPNHSMDDHGIAESAHDVYQIYISISYNKIRDKKL